MKKALSQYAIGLALTISVVAFFVSSSSRAWAINDQPVIDSLNQNYCQAMSVEALVRTVTEEQSDQNSEEEEEPDCE